VPTGAEIVEKQPAGGQAYTVEVEGRTYAVKVSDAGDVSSVAFLPVVSATEKPSDSSSPSGAVEPIKAPLSGTVVKVLVGLNQSVIEGEPVLILEAMKMETQVSAPRSGIVSRVIASSGDAVAVGDALVELR
ncbi:MAG TPA: oxaloacetate decarboxylase, partial [Porticoccaceae bacterium]|nr:oxaloacetate decarboxylase [Porticoccaceae bacterium]